LFLWFCKGTEHTLRVLRRISGPKRGEVTTLYNEKLHNLYYSPRKVTMIKSRRMRWAGNVERMKEKRNADRL
jgi:hypothetical protein